MSNTYTRNRLLTIILCSFLINLSITAQITIDGLFDDWDTAPTTLVGTNGTTSLEVTDSGGQLCLHISGTNLVVTQDTYLDSDCAPETGYNGGNVWAANGQGADFLLQGASSYSSPYTSSNSGAWGWNWVGGIPFNPNSYTDGEITDIEYCFDLPPSCGSVSIGACITDDNIQYCIPSETPVGSYFSYTLLDSNLPIDLISFTTEKVNARTNVLKWETGFEINNEYFEIQKSNDGIDWNSIATIKGNGDSNTAQNYKWIDYNAFEMNYYRLKQVDLDGAFTFSDIESMQNKDSRNLSISPNPANSYFRISADAPIDINEIAIYDNLGNYLNNKINIIESSSLSLEIDISALPNAIYHLRLQEQHFTVLKTN